jgi:16S rRNA (cytosine967-C5)-methyltransferase
LALPVAVAERLKLSPTLQRIVLAGTEAALSGTAELGATLSQAGREAQVAPIDRLLCTIAARTLIRYKRRIEYSRPDVAMDHALALLLSGPIDDADALGRITDPIERAAVEHSIPSWLAVKCIDDMGFERATATMARMNTEPPLTLRVNSVKASRDEVLSKLAARGFIVEPTPYAPFGVTLKSGPNVFADPLFADGALEVQDEASQLVAEIVAPPPGGVVVDVCAGAGGKTLAIGAALQNRGRIFALDRHTGRLAELRKRARRAGVHNVQALAMEFGRESGNDSGDEYTRGVDVHLTRVRGAAHRVLVDAPCSGLGAIRRNPEARWRLTPESFQRLPEEQLLILNAAAQFVAPGGRLIYAVCTFLKSECEDIVAQFVSDNDQFAPMSVREVFGRVRATPVTDERGIALRTWDHDNTMDGFFAAVLRRKPKASLST